LHSQFTRFIRDDDMNSMKDGVFSIHDRVDVDRAAVILVRPNATAVRMPHRAGDRSQALALVMCTSGGGAIRGG
jgi:hypothetical protein